MVWPADLVFVADICNGSARSSKPTKKAIGAANEMKMFCNRPYMSSRKKNTVVFDDIGFISEQSQNIAKEYIESAKKDETFQGDISKHDIILELKNNLQFFKDNELFYYIEERFKSF